MSERVISFDRGQALIKAAGDAPSGDPARPEWFVIRHLAHAMRFTGAERRFNLAKFADHLEEFLKSQPN